MSARHRLGYSPLSAILLALSYANGASAQSPLSTPDSLRQQNEILEQRLRLFSQQRAPQSSDGKPLASVSTAGDREDSSEWRRLDYSALAGIALELATQFACNGKNVILYGPSQSESLLQLRAFYDQLEELRARLKALTDLAQPSSPDKQPSGAASQNVSAFSAPVLQSVLNLMSSLQGAREPEGTTVEGETALIAVVGSAAIAKGCNVFWPSQLAVDPLNARSAIMNSLQSLAALNDSSSGPSFGLQQRLQSINVELQRAGEIRANLQRQIAEEHDRLVHASGQIDELKAEIELISAHIADQKNTAIQQKLNRTFEKSWEEADAAIRKQLASALPGTLEEQNKQGEMTRRVDVLKTRTDWLSQFVKDEQSLAIQDKLRRFLTARWDLYELATKRKLELLSSVPREVDPLSAQQKSWERYSAELQEISNAFNSASDAYSTFRGALLNASSGSSPLSRMLRAEALRNLTFDETSQPRNGASIIQVIAQRVTNTRGSRTEYGYSISFIQYEPNGKLRNAGVRTVYK